MAYQTNNKFRPFSTSATYIFSDAQLSSEAVVATGGVPGAANAKLYNSLSAETTLPITALTDLIAAQNPLVTFGQSLSVEDWITAVTNTFATKKSVDDIVDGTTTVSITGTLNDVSLIENSGLLQNNTASPTKIIRQIEVIDDTLFTYNTTDATMTITFPIGKTLAQNDLIEIEFYIALQTDAGNNLNYGTARMHIDTAISTSTSYDTVLANHYASAPSVGVATVYLFDGNMNISIYSDRIVVSRPYRMESGDAPHYSGWQNILNPSKIYRILRIID